ncbi:hypothetical protein [Mucilaginibacter aquariorum]|uniref:Uncharacterized protein n=1 Tax=Mucilaginibacter aquariorum TaxID=2967225 RepID=A0ABT1SY47_9SPHI|nr:hypothetical protein [Mucilaginibacter aquariorum]MCQ6956991.1 hypothetical protein [Mucilaginibacter aquariorum]
MLQSQVLSSASILLAILTALYGLFYLAIKEAIDFKVYLEIDLKADNPPILKDAKRIYTGKMLPLLVGGIILSAVFAPEFWKELKLSVKNLLEYGWAGTDYNFTVAAFLAVSTFTFLQTINIIILAIKLCGKINTLNKNLPAKK